MLYLRVNFVGAQKPLSQLLGSLGSVSERASWEWFWSIHDGRYTLFVLHWVNRSWNTFFLAEGQLFHTEYVILTPTDRYVSKGRWIDGRLRVRGGFLLHRLASMVCRRSALSSNGPNDVPALLT